MNGTKNALQSVTIWSAIVLILSQIIRYFGVEVSPDEQSVIVDNALATITSVMNIVGVVGVIYGRYRASKSITIVPGPPSMPGMIALLIIPALTLGGCAKSAEARYYQQVSVANAARAAIIAQHQAGNIDDVRLVELDTYEKATRAALGAVKARLEGGITTDTTLNAMLDTADVVASELIRFLQQHEGATDGRGTDSGDPDAGAGGHPVGPAVDRPDQRADSTGQTERPADARADRPDRAPAAPQRAAVGRSGRGGEETPGDAVRRAA